MAQEQRPDGSSWRAGGSQVSWARDTWAQQLSGKTRLAILPTARGATQLWAAEAGGGRQRSQVAASSPHDRDKGQEGLPGGSRQRLALQAFSQKESGC